jgi:hypothetical protein
MTGERYVSFGERIGAVTPLTLPADDVSREFRNAVWNAAEPYLRTVDLREYHSVVRPISLLANMGHEKHWAAERRHDENRALTFIKEYLLLNCAWHEVYEFLERFPRWGKLESGRAANWAARMKQLLIEFRSPFQLVAGQLAPLTSKEEQESVAQSAEMAGKFGVAAEHMRTALTHFSARPKPDYDNTCKEAASAVEAALNTANGKQLAVGEAVKEFAKSHTVHPALVESANKLFGYASDRDGVRHASKGTSTPVDFDEAKLVIVAASAWVNFIAAKAP